MDDLKIIDKFINDMEFRNYIHGRLVRHPEYKRVRIDDITLCDDDSSNDNDILATRDGLKYTFQTFLNRDITLSDLEETNEDIVKEKAYGAVVVTNRSFDKNIMRYAKDNNIIIWDREKLAEFIDSIK